MEYPGYGIYEGTPTEDQISEDAVRVFDFLTVQLKISEKSIFVLGRSMGSGPAIHLSSVRHPSNLILVSPYMSIKKVSDDLVGKFLTFFVKERFCNFVKIEDIECPILIIHGKMDELIRVEHSEELAKMATCAKKVKLILVEKMKHNVFDVYIDIANPIFEFFKEINYNLLENKNIKIEAILAFNLIYQKFNEMKNKKNGGINKENTSINSNN